MTESSWFVTECSCQGDGYLNESTLSKPVYCTCEVGIAAQRKDTPEWLFRAAWERNFREAANTTRQAKLPELDDHEEINWPIDFDLIDEMMEPPQPKMTKGQRKVLMQKLRRMSHPS